MKSRNAEHDYVLFYAPKFIACVSIKFLKYLHIKCYKAIELKLLIVSKNVSDKIFNVREGRHTGPPYFFLSVKVLKLRQDQLHFFKGL